MNRKRLFQVALVGAAALLIVAMFWYLGVVELPGEDQYSGPATVVVSDENGTEKAVIEVEVADTRQERFTGLSDHETLADGEGMWFVYDGESQHTYVMRRMEFPLDIIFVGADGRINSIHHRRAPRPNEDGNEITATGTGQYVLEVPRGYANETGMEVGDYVEPRYNGSA
ncbi:DUF192 domain-containing protein [Haloarchaeobius iranensis]|uniref:DUF192 domain-containing protein n=1 Tax=Haloarchaeobius iranensis TaxID=996166 RepID=A0A1G9XD90_9EURY|nr:DUF192 domain-containing protein [Haloarchaeobius iranensis]SDM94759.1 hypothetical protein SAMN05192554_11061 [Haloarchaeobius iranensis]